MVLHNVKVVLGYQPSSDCSWLECTRGPRTAQPAPFQLTLQSLTLLRDLNFFTFPFLLFIYLDYYCYRENSWQISATEKAMDIKNLMILMAKITKIFFYENLSLVAKRAKIFDKCWWRRLWAEQDQDGGLSGPGSQCAIDRHPQYLHIIFYPDMIQLMNNNHESIQTMMMQI